MEKHTTENFWFYTFFKKTFGYRVNLMVHKYTKHHFESFKKEGLLTLQ